MNLFLIDIGATKIRFGRSDGRRLLATQIHSTPADWPRARTLCREVAGELFGRNKIQQTVVGVAGMVSADRRKVLTMPNLPRWTPANVVPDLRRWCGRVIVENDAVLNALGETHVGAGRGRQIIGFLTVSTGVNGVRIVAGQPDAHTFPVELRHMLVRYRDRDVTLGHAISGRSLERQYGKKPEHIKSAAAWLEVTRALSWAIVNLGLTWAPEMIVLGGSITKSIRLPILRREVRNLWHHRCPPPAIVKGRLGHLSGLYGALSLAKKH